MFILCFFPMVPAGCWFWPIPAILRKSLKVNEVFITSFIFPNSASWSTSFYILILAGYHFFLLLGQVSPCWIWGQQKRNHPVCWYLRSWLVDWDSNSIGEWQKFTVEHVPDWFMWTIDIHWTSLTLPVSPENPRICYSLLSFSQSTYTTRGISTTGEPTMFGRFFSCSDAKSHGELFPGESQRLKALTTSLLGSSPEDRREVLRWVRHGEMLSSWCWCKNVVSWKQNRKAEDNVTFQLQE